MNKMTDLRKKIDDIDAKIIALLKKREGVIREIGLIKKEKDQKITDLEREKAITSKLNTKMEKAVFKAIIKESKKIQAEDLTKR